VYQLMLLVISVLLVHVVNDLQAKSFRSDDDREHRIVRAALKLLEDTNDGLQKNHAVKCLNSLKGKVKERNIKIRCDQLCLNEDMINLELYPVFIKFLVSDF
jgi:hypothetical protein